MLDNDIPDQPARPLDRGMLVRFIAGELSPVETAVVERWLAEDSGGSAELAELQRIWTQAGALPSDARLEGLWRDLQRQIHEAPTVQQRPALRVLQPRRSETRYWVVGALAAASIAAVAVGIARHPEWMTPASVSPQPAERIYSTARGQRIVAELADGSRIELGVDSRIRVRLYDGGRREVHLEGEAVFDVVHDERRPFLVYAGNAVTEDLGTKFGVRAYPGDRAVQVVVVSGKVALRSAQPGAAASTRQVVLGPRDVSELDAAGEARVRRNIDPDEYLAWTRGRLVFRRASVAEIAVRLERWYNVDIAVADPVATRWVTLDLDAPSLDEALEAVAVPLGLRYERTGRHVKLHR